MKKVLVVLLTLAMVFSFAACGGGDDTSGESGTTGTTGESGTSGTTGETGEKVPSEELKLTNSGYHITGEGSDFYAHYSAQIKNPNKDMGVLYATVRITARDAEGAVLGTEDEMVTDIYPGQTATFAGQGPNTSESPATVDIELIQPKEHEWEPEDEMDYPGYQPMTVINPTMNGDDIVGEIENPNDFAIESAIVVVVFKNEDGSWAGGEYDFVEAIPASGTAPFEVWSYDAPPLVEYEVFVNPW